MTVAVHSSSPCCDIVPPPAHALNVLTPRPQPPPTPAPMQYGLTPLHYVAACGRAQTHQPAMYEPDVAARLAKVLLKAGAQPNVVDQVG